MIVNKKRPDVKKPETVQKTTRTGRQIRGSQKVRFLKPPNFLRMNFFPVTYNLPGEYSIYYEEYKRNSKSVWIMKPVGKA